MSRVIGFRLDPNNPREAEALAILEAQREAGYGTRDVLTEALLRLAMADDEHQGGLQLEEVAAMMNTISHQLSLLQTVPHQQQNGERASLSKAFLESVKTAAKPGVRLDA